MAENRPPPAVSPGRLVIADRVVERVAMLAAAEIGGVATTGSSLDRALGRAYPKVDASISGERVRLRIDLAVTWPVSMPEVASSVRVHVADRVSRLVGMHVDAVDVTTAKVVRADMAPTNAHRRVE